MAATSPETKTARLRLIAEVPPPEQWDGRWTEFGLQDKERQLHLGHPRPDGSIQFDFDVQTRLNPSTGALRFGGPFVHGTPAEPFVYLSWKYVGEPPQWIRRQKIPLAAIIPEQIEHAQLSQGIMLATVPPITTHAASVRVQWTLLAEPRSRA